MPKACSRPLGIISLPSPSSRPPESWILDCPEDSDLSQTFQRLAGTSPEMPAINRIFPARRTVHCTLLHADLGQLLLDLDTMTESLRAELGAT